MVKKKPIRPLKTLTKYGKSVAPPTDEDKQKILHAVVEEGKPGRPAARELGIPSLTLAIWLAEDKAFRDFYGWVQKEFVSTMGDLCLTVIRSAILKGDWKAAAWYLERQCGYSIPLSSTSQGKITVEFKDDPFRQTDGGIVKTDGENESVKNVKCKKLKKETE